MNFKEEVEFYLKKNNKFDYYGFDIANDDIAEEDDTEGVEDETSEASVKTKKCPKCGKNPCECSKNASLKTGTHGEEDDDGWHASTNTPPADFGATPEEREMINLIRKNRGLGSGFKAETPEEKEMLKLAEKIARSKSTVDDKGKGYAPCVNTKEGQKCVSTKKDLKEEILKNL